MRLVVSDPASRSAKAYADIQPRNTFEQIIVRRHSSPWGLIDRPRYFLFEQIPRFVHMAVAKKRRLHS